MDRTDFEPWKGKEVAKLLALVENQRRYYQDLISALPVGLVVLSAKRSVVSSNRAFRQAFGVRGEDLRGKSIEQLLPSDRLIENIRNAMVHGIAQPPVQVEHAGKLWRVAILPLRNWDDEMEMETLLVVEDLTGLAVGAPAAAPQTASPFDNIPAVVWRADAAGFQLTAVSGGEEPLLGYAAAHWLKTPSFFAQRIHPEDREAVLALYRTAVQQSREVSAEFRMVTAAGALVWCRETVRLAGAGVLTGILTVMGQRRQIEQMQITAERNSALHGLSARLAHDLNNPLMIISGYAEEILRPLAPNDPRRGELEEILAATERISNLTAQLLEFTRKQAGAAERVDLSGMLAGLAEASVEIRAAKPVWAKANRKQLEEILAALVSAVKEQRARVTITCDTAAITEHVAGATFAPGTYARLTLAIPGRGMDPEKRKAIFESFVHKETDKPVGAALARAYALVREWGGDLGFESEATQGSSFTMYLPLAEAEAAQPKAPVAAATPAEALRETILVVDDEAGIRALIVKILRRERYRVLEAGSVAEAVAAAAAHGGPIQLLLTDVMLPDRNGRQLATQLLETRPGLKVVYISGFTDDDAVRSGAFPPGARFLQKPFTLGALMGTVREALDQ
ncbi:MAG TPA: response regulator [Bryobacteraceae bacterium]|nr:response regulator [Bryobacteraceae bacterium]